MYTLSKDENAHRLAVRGKNIKKQRERETETERETARDREKQREIDRDGLRCKHKEVNTKLLQEIMT